MVSVAGLFLFVPPVYVTLDVFGAALLDGAGITLIPSVKVNPKGTPKLIGILIDSTSYLIGCQFEMIRLTVLVISLFLGIGTYAQNYTTPPLPTVATSSTVTTSNANSLIDLSQANEILKNTNTLVGLVSGSVGLLILAAFAISLFFLWYCCKTIDKIKIGKDGVEIDKDEDHDMTEKVEKK